MENNTERKACCFCHTFKLERTFLQIVQCVADNVWQRGTASQDYLMLNAFLVSLTIDSNYIFTNIKKQTPKNLLKLERKTRFELATLALARRCSTTEPLPHIIKLIWNNQNASNRNRTSDTRIFSPLLYRLSYRGLKKYDADGNRTHDLQRDRLAF